VAGDTLEADALLDTGFDGAVAIPSASLSSGTTPDSHALWQLADGSESLAPVYRGTLRVGLTDPFRVLVTALGTEILIGRQVCSHFRIVLDHGIRATLED